MNLVENVTSQIESSISRVLRDELIVTDSDSEK